MIDWKTGWSKCSDEEKLQRAQIVVDIYDKAYDAFTPHKFTETMRKWRDVAWPTCHDGNRMRDNLLSHIKKRNDSMVWWRLALDLHRRARVLELLTAHAELLIKDR